MAPALRLIAPRFVPPLEPEFRPAVLANRAFRGEISASGQGVPLIIALERSDGSVSRYETVAFPEGHPRFEANLTYAERIVKFLLWAPAAGRSPSAAARHRSAHRQGLCSERPTQVRPSLHGRAGLRPSVHRRELRRRRSARGREGGQPLGRHLEGCRIGFDLGTSDLKVSAVVDGEAILSDEIVWETVEQADPTYHYEQIVAALKLARSKLPRLDAIGGSSAGVIVDNRPMVASLFHGIPAKRSVKSATCSCASGPSSACRWRWRTTAT